MLVDPTEERLAAFLAGLAAEPSNRPAPPPAVPPAAAAAGGGGGGEPRTVIAVLALPPGGGKSTLFGALRQAGAAVVSSDALRARQLPPAAFDGEMADALRRHPIVCYDKNVPNPEGLAKLVRTLTAAARQQPAAALRLLLVVPSRLEHDTAWRRSWFKPPSALLEDSARAPSEGSGRAYTTRSAAPAARELGVAPAARLRPPQS